MLSRARFGWTALLVGSAAIGVACSINPQPLPPGESVNGPEDDAGLALPSTPTTEADGSAFVTGGSGTAPDGGGSNANNGADGAATDAASDASEDAATGDGGGDAALSDGSTDASDASDAARDH